MELRLMAQAQNRTATLQPPVLLHRWRH